MPSKLRSSLSRFFAPITNIFDKSSADRGTAETPHRKPRYSKWVAETEKAWHAKLPRKYSAGDASVSAQQLERGGAGASLQNVSAQAQSSLFGKLPRELRDMIYEYALSGETFVVKVANPHPYDWPEERFKLQWCVKAIELFTLSRSCKLGRIEATPYIYKSNTFLIPNITSFYVFQRLVPPYLLHTITMLTIQCKYYHLNLMFDFMDGLAPDNLDFWKSVFDAMAKMHGLKYVCIDMLTNTPYVDAPDEDMMFGPIRVLEHVQRVEVYTCWEPHGSLQGVEREWPFRVERGVKSLIEDYGGC